MLKNSQNPPNLEILRVLEINKNLIKKSQNPLKFTQKHDQTVAKSTTNLLIPALIPLVSPNYDLGERLERECVERKI